MQNNFCLDVETLSVESTCVVLSAAIVYFDFESEFTYQDLLDRALFVKFDAREQADMGRHVSKSTLEFWKEQSPEVRALAINKHPSDVSAVDGLARIKEYIAKHGGSNTYFWQRGTLDSTSLESLCRSVGVEAITNYNNWMDVRTAIRLTKETSNPRGYCKVPDFDPIVVDKHHPVPDIAYDVMMLRYGI